MRTAISLCILLAVTSGSSPAQSAKPRVDAHEYALPEAAIARLGTLRLVHLGGLYSIAVSPDGKMVASGVSSGEHVDTNLLTVGSEPATFHRLTYTLGTIRLWDADTGALLRDITTPDAPVTALTFAHDGRTLYAGCGKFVCSFDVASGKKLWDADPGTNMQLRQKPEITRIVSTGDRLLCVHGVRITGSSKKTWGMTQWGFLQHLALFVKSASGKFLPAPKSLELSPNDAFGIPRAFHEVATSPDGRFVAIMISEAEVVDARDNKPGAKSKATWNHRQCRVQITDLTTNKIVATLPTGEIVRNLTFSPDSRRLVFNADKTIWQVRMEKLERECLVQEMTFPITKLAFVANDRVAAEFWDDAIRVFDLDGKPVTSHNVREHDFTGVKAGNTCAVRLGNAIQIIDCDTGKPRHAFAGHHLTPAVRFARESNGVLLSRDTENAHRWDTRTWVCTDSVNIPRDATLSKWERWDKPDFDDRISLEKGLIAAREGDSLRLRDLKTDVFLRFLQDCAGTYATFTADGRRMAVHEDRHIRIYDVGTGKLVSDVTVSYNRYQGYRCPDRLSPTGRYYATNRDHLKINLHDIDTGLLARSLVPSFHDPKKYGSVFGFQFSDCERFVVGEVHDSIEREDRFHLDKTSVALWHTQSGALIQEILVASGVFAHFRTHYPQPILARLALSPDQRFVALTRINSKSIEVWEVASGTKRGELFGHAGIVADIAFSPDGRQLASSSEDTTILIWDLDRPFRRGIYPHRLDETDLTLAWHALLEPDAWQADDAIWSLVHAAKVSVSFLKKHLPPSVRPDPEHVRKLLAALDSQDFRTRASAEAELERLAEQVLVELQAAVKANNSLERRRRLDTLLQKAQLAAKPFGTAQRIRHWRAIEVLERISTPEAIALLRDIASGVQSAPVTKAAQEAVKRISKEPRM